ncbi:MAG: chaperonin GroEL [Proteobacteria bacterium]|nr:MAG: chaperonin GroEL [Pseudomonadota bacterium]
MSVKSISFGNQSREAMLKGVDVLANAVKVTLGPKGRNVLIDRDYGGPLITKDGVTVAKVIDLDDKFQNMGVQLVKEVASKTADQAGDGTTTATVLAQAIFREGAKLVAAGHNPMELKRGIDLAVAAIITEIDKLSKPCETKEDITHVGSISANNDREIGMILADAMEKVGRDGVITVDEAKGTETILTVVEGMQFDRGYLSPYFVTNAERMTVELEDAYILLVEKKVSSMKDLLPILEQVVRAQKPLLIIAEDIDGDALSTLVINKLRGTLRIAAVKAPAFGDRRKAMLEDLAALTGGTLVQEETGMTIDTLDMTSLGFASRITIDKDNTTIVSSKGDKDVIKARTGQIRRQIVDSTSDYDKTQLQERLAKLIGGVAVISVGAASEAEMREKKARVEDALHSTRAAVAEGVVAGGGVALVRCQHVLDKLKLSEEQQHGVRIIFRAIEEPARQILINSGLEPAPILVKIREGKEGFGFNAYTEQYEDLLKAGVLDPAKVTKTALTNAASIASLLLTTEAMITDKPAGKSSSSGAGGQSGGGHDHDHDHHH